MKNINSVLSLLFLVLGGLNAYFAIDFFINGEIGFGVFNGSVALYAYACMTAILFEGGSRS
jgi:hypothetical protein